MKPDSRLSDVLHVALHLAQEEDPVTSEVLARALGTHAVVVRRILAGLREHGYVHSGKGHGGGWTLARDPAGITLRDVHAALGSPSLLAVGHRAARPGCRVEAAVNAALGGALREAEALLLERLGEVTLAQLLADVSPRGRAHRAGRLHAHG